MLNCHHIGSRIAMVGLVLGMGLSSFSATAAELTGRQIVDEMERRHDRPYELELQDMTLVEKSGNREDRKLKRYSREVEGGNRYLMVFHEPSGIKGSALLTWQHDKKDDDQWLHLPSMGKKLKRIAKGGKKNYFMGTDYTYEDLVSEPKDKFQYTRLDDADVDGKSVYVVESIAVDEALKKESGYSKQVLFIDKDIFLAVKTDYYDRRSRLLKTQVVSDVQQIEGETYRGNKSVMTNHRKKHSTEIVTTSRSFEEGEVPKKLFRERTIKSGRHLN